MYRKFRYFNGSQTYLDDILDRLLNSWSWWPWENVSLDGRTEQTVCPVYNPHKGLGPKVKCISVVAVSPQRDCNVRQRRKTSRWSRRQNTGAVRSASARSMHAAGRLFSQPNLYCSQLHTRIIFIYRMTGVRKYIYTSVIWEMIFADSAVQRVLLCCLNLLHCADNTD